MPTSAPTGQHKSAEGVTPSKRGVDEFLSPERAKETYTTYNCCQGILIISPFQGLGIRIPSYQWASPIADLFRPFRPEEPK